MGGEGLELLPHTVLQSILARLDVPSICAAAASCRLLYLSAAEVFPLLQSFHLLEIASTCHWLSRLLSCNVVLRSLKLDCSHLDDAAIDFILRPQLEEICLRNCERFSANLLMEIGRRCCNLRSLSLELGWQDDSRGTGNYSAGLEHLLQGCSLLESLSLRCAVSCFDSQAYGAILRLVAPTLKVLDLGYVPERDAKQLFSFNIHDITGQSVGRSSFNYQNLRKVSLVLDRITDTFMMIICDNLSCLSDLELQDEPSEEPLLAYDLTNWGVQQIGAFSKLIKLALVRSQDWYPASFKRVNDLGILLLAEKCTNLESIRLEGFSRITDAACRAILHNCLNLHTFELLQSKLTDLAFLDLPATPLKLVSVNLASCSLISDASLKHLAYCRGLKLLDLNGCRRVGDDGVNALSVLCKLRTLILNNTEVSDAGLLMLGKGSTPLVVLSLRGCQKVSDAGVVALVDGPIVRTLQCIDLSSIPSVTDNAVLGLIRSGMHITELRLRDCPYIGDTSVIALASMNFKGQGCGGTLRLLDIWNCDGVSQLSAGWFKKPYFPRLRWLGLGWNLLNQCLLDALTKERPSMRILWHGVELDHYVSGEIYGSYKPYYEEEDELVRFLGDD